jgi:hypothetical protein
MKENKRKNSGRPKLNRSDKLTVIKGSIEQWKLDFLVTFEDKKLNEKQVRDFIKFCTNFAYNLGSYEKAIDTIKSYEINNSTNKPKCN